MGLGKRDISVYLDQNHKWTQDGRRKKGKKITSTCVGCVSGLKRKREQKWRRNVATSATICNLIHFNYFSHLLAFELVFVVLLVKKGKKEYVTIDN